jgi:hypothetical protein
MNRNEIVAQIDAEIARLQKVQSILSGTNITTSKTKTGPTKVKVLTTPTAVKKRTMSPEGRLRIAAAQKARWAKSRKAAKAA